jgi:hypothetical protein
MSLSEALAERVRALARTNERLHAIEDGTAGHVVEKGDAEAVLQQALAALNAPAGYAQARRILAGEHVTGCEELAKAGLVVWDPLADTLGPSPLLIELIKVVDGETQR